MRCQADFFIVWSLYIIPWKYSILNVATQEHQARLDAAKAVASPSTGELPAAKKRKTEPQERCA